MTRAALEVSRTAFEVTRTALEVTIRVAGTSGDRASA